MEGIRNIALVGLGLLISFISTHFGLALAGLIFLPLFLLWFTFWEDKKVRQAKRRYSRSVSYPPSNQR